MVHGLAAHTAPNVKKRKAKSEGRARLRINRRTNAGIDEPGTGNERARARYVDRLQRAELARRAHGSTSGGGVIDRRHDSVRCAVQQCVQASDLAGYNCTSASRTVSRYCGYGCLIGKKNQSAARAGKREACLRVERATGGMLAVLHYPVMFSLPPAQRKGKITEAAVCLLAK